MQIPLKVMTILGTRPEVIRLSAVIDRLDAVANHVLVHTGQNYDYELNEVFFEELGVRRPDHFLAVNTSSLARSYGDILVKSEEVVISEKPDAVLILGDTNSALAALIAKRYHIPVYHMEAGNRSFDDNVPEEVNRRIVDHIADFNLVYTERARQNLLAEGLSPRRIYLTGSPLREVVDRHLTSIEASTALADNDLTVGEFFLVSLHREENVDSPSRLAGLMRCLHDIAEEHEIPVLVSTHPRTRRRLEDLGEVTMHPGVVFAQPFGYFDYNCLQTAAKCVISDSGSIAEEAAILQFPAITLRDSMERPEALETGTIVLTGIDSDTVLAAIDLQVSKWQSRAPISPPEYQIPDVSERVTALILGTAKLSNVWSGVRPSHLA